jgi:hypothetical protein
MSLPSTARKKPAATRRTFQGKVHFQIWNVPVLASIPMFRRPVFVPFAFAAGLDSGVDSGQVEDISNEKASAMFRLCDRAVHRDCLFWYQLEGCVA